MVHERINFQSKVENNWEKVGPLGGNPSFSPPRPLYTQIPRLTFSSILLHQREGSVSLEYRTIYSTRAEERNRQS